MFRPRHDAFVSSEAFTIVPALDPYGHEEIIGAFVNGKLRCVTL